MKRGMLMLMASLTVAAVGCGKDTPAGKAADHINDETNKKNTALMLAGQWRSACDAKNILWEAVGVKSSKTVYDFSAAAGKTIELYSDEGCNALVGKAEYTGNAIIGTPTAVEESNILDLNYSNVVVTITDQAAVDLINAPLTPGCGHSDWKINESKDVTNESGALNCPVTKPGPVFDIVKTDGTSLFFGKADATHDKKSDGARPVELDRDAKFTH